MTESIDAVSGKPATTESNDADRVRERSSEKSEIPLKSKLRQRIAAGKPADLVIADVDGTVYVKRSGSRAYFGENQETAKALTDKNLPFLLNTARPIWDENEDARFSTKIGLPIPDAIMAGDGTMIFWRQKDGTLIADQEYADRIKQHRITIKRDGQAITTQFNPQLVQYAAMPLLSDYIQSGMLVESLIDQGPILPDGTLGLEGLRLVAQRMPYDEIIKLSRELKKYVSGVKLQMSEITELTDADLFTGWLHIVPSNAGKNEVIKYVLSQLKDVVPADLHAHVLGDTSVDIPMLAMGSDPQRDGYTVHQYAVGNLPERTKTKLGRVVETLSKPEAQGLSKKAHLTLLEQPGPDALHQVVSTLT